MSNVTTEETANDNITRLSSETLDQKLQTFGSASKLLTDEDRVAFIKQAEERINSAWNAPLSCSVIATLRGVSTTSVVTYFNNDLVRTDDPATAIRLIGSGKPRKSNTDKLTSFMEKTGMSVEDVKKILGL